MVDPGSTITGEKTLTEPKGDEYPSISVIMPVRNEAAYIERSLGAMLNQDYPGTLEVIVVDGMSDDGTREVVGALAADDPRIRLIDNPQHIVPAAMNVGIQAACHELVARMDGHTRAPTDYLRRCVDLMHATGAEHTGGRIIVEGQTYWAAAIAAAMESPFGVGPADWRGAAQTVETDTVPFGVWRRETMLALGGFDEILVRNQDYEFNYRLRAAGGRIIYSPQITTIYYSRQGLAGLWRQYYQYGLWKARVLRMHPGSLRARHLAAPAFVAGLAGGMILSRFGRAWRRLYGTALGVYGILSAGFAMRQGVQRGWRYLPAILLAFVTMHIAWGVGFWVGVLRWWIDGRDRREGL